MKIRKELQVGTMAIIAAFLFYQGMNFLKGNDFFSSNVHYYAVFEDIKGLAVSTPVTISGYTIGRVDDIELLQKEGNKVKVIFKIDKDIVLNEKSKIILAKDFLGEITMKLDVGTGSKAIEPESQVQAYLEPEMADMVMEQVEPIQKKVASLTGNVNGLVDSLKKSEDNINASIADIRDMTHDLKLMLRENRPSIRRTLSNVNQISADLKSNMDTVNQMLTNFNSFSKDLKQTDLPGTLAKVDTTMGNVNLLAKDLQDGKGSLGKLLKNDSVYDNTNKAILQLESLLSDMEANPKRYVHFSVFGRKDKKEKDKK